MHVVRDWLLVGKLRDTLHTPLLREYGVGAVLQLCREVTQPDDIASLFLAGVEDGEPLPPAKLDTGVAFIRQQRAAGQTVLVACGAGISRSVSFAIAALHEEEGLSLLDAFRQVHTVHPDGRPHPRLWQSLCKRYGDDTPFVALFKKTGPTDPAA